MVVFLVLLFHNHVTNEKSFPLGSPTQDKHIVKIEEDRNNESSENLLSLPHQEVRSSSDTSLTGNTSCHTCSHQSISPIYYSIQ